MEVEGYMRANMVGTDKLYVKTNSSNIMRGKYSFWENDYGSGESAAIYINNSNFTHALVAQ